MKNKALLLIAAGFLLMGCQKNWEKTMYPENTTETPQREHRDPMAWENQIKLSAGSKWQANRETTEGIENMLVLVRESSKASLEEFEQLSISLSSELNTLIEKCTMEGAAHDNLHIYLKPLIVKIAELDSVTSKEQKRNLTTEIEKHLKAYAVYFQ